MNKERKKGRKEGRKAITRIRDSLPGRIRCTPKIRLVSKIWGARSVCL